MESTSYDIDEHSSCNSKEETDSNKDSESSELPADALQWKNGVGMLAGSDIKVKFSSCPSSYFSKLTTKLVLTDSQV